MIKYYEILYYLDEALDNVVTEEFKRKDVASQRLEGLKRSKGVFGLWFTQRNEDGDLVDEFYVEGVDESYRGLKLEYGRIEKIITVRNREVWVLNNTLVIDGNHELVFSKSETLSDYRRAYNIIKGLERKGK